MEESTMELVLLRMVIRSLVRDAAAPSQLPLEGAAFRQLSSAQQASVRTLHRYLLQTRGDIGALVPNGPMTEWCAPSDRAPAVERQADAV
jgi:hypothetical protein